MMNNAQVRLEVKQMLIGGTAANGFIPILAVNYTGHPGGSASGFETAYASQTLPRVDSWTVDQLTLDGNTIYSNNTDGDIKFVTNGDGQVIINDDTKLTFGASEDASIEYDEDGTDKVQVTGKGWVYNGVPVEIITPGTGDGLLLITLVFLLMSSDLNLVLEILYSLIHIQMVWIVMVWLSSKVVYKLMELQPLLTLQTHH